MNPARRQNKENIAPGGQRMPRPVSLEEAELIEQVRAGRTDAFENLVRKYQDRVFNTCWRIAGNLEDARDLTQDAFLKAYESIGGFRGQSGFYTWVFRIAVNLSLSHRRKSARRKTASLDAVPDGSQVESLAKRLTARQEDPERGARDADRRARVAAALSALDDDHRAMIVLRDMEGFDYREIAEILELPEGTVKSRLFRARQALRELLEAGEHETAG